MGTSLRVGTLPEGPLQRAASQGRLSTCMLPDLCAHLQKMVFSQLYLIGNYCLYHYFE